jgi:four helix bundle protein
MRVRRFQELDVYNIACEVQQEIFELSKTFPKEETYSLTDQVRRSSRAVGANIAEAWRKRRYPAHFASTLTDADAENAGTQHWIDTAHACGYVDDSIKDSVFDRLETVGGKLGRMISDPEAWQPR